MSGICGFIAHNGPPVDENVIFTMAEASSYRGPDGINFWLEDNAAMAHLAFHTTPEAVRETQPLFDMDRGLVLVSDARLDNREELIGNLLSRRYLNNREPTEPELILAAYNCWGTSCSEHLIGKFVFAIWEVQKRRLFLARDHLGASPCYYYSDAKIFAFASEANQLRQLPGVGAVLNERMVAAHILATPVPENWTYFEDISLLPSAHTLITQDGSLTLQRYWQLDPQKTIFYKNDDQYAEHILDLFRQAVVSRLRSPKPVASMLSGGLDSSAIVSVAADHQNKIGNPGYPRTYTWDFTGDEAILRADEQVFAKEVASYWNLPLKTIPAQQHWPLGDIDQFSLHPDSPFVGHFQALVRATLLAARAGGANVLTSGTPGDNLVGGGVYPYLDYLLHGRWKKLWEDLKAHGELWDRSFGEITRLRLLLPLRKSVNVQLGRRPMHFYRSQPPDWITDTLMKRARFDELLEELQVDTPRHFRSHAQRERFSSLKDPINFRIYLWLDRLAAQSGMEFRHPWLDVRLFEFVFAIPQDQLRMAGINKYILRNALKGVAPENVRLRQRKAVPSPLYQWSLKVKAKKTIRSLLKDPLVAQFGYVEAKKLSQYYEAYIDGRVTNPQPIWFTISLELWLRQLETTSP